ncbi:MAG: hypothetical protein ACOYN5_15680 [Bacteroidales bacterium]|jgi:hypothetical protein
MATNEIIIISLCLIWVIILPYFLKDKIFQFCTIIILPFVYSYLLYSTMVNGSFTKISIFLFVLLAGAMIYKAYKFYKTYLSDL